MEEIKIRRFLDGYGDGNGYGNKIVLKTYRESPVHYIDSLPCVVRSIRGQIARVDVINTNTFLSTEMYVAKHGGLFAHGKTIQEAIELVQEKWAETRSIEERIDEFKATFKKGVKYSARLFYKSHSILTGSCQAGKDHWIDQQGINLDSEMTVDEFCALTQNAYGGDAIRKLIEQFKN